MADERHDDFAEIPIGEYESDYVCTNHECEHYRVSIGLRCYRDELGAAGLVDERDLDCPCGASRVQVETLGVERVSPEIVKRYQEVSA